jgi:hypothetical protein
MTSRFICLAAGALMALPVSVRPQSLTGRTVRALSTGDYVLPRFSPNGRLLALSQVLADTATENTQVLILDLARSTVDTVLPATAAAKYGVYKSYVTDFQWLTDTTLRAWIPDGDVGVTTMTLDVHSRTILKEENHQGGDDDSASPKQALAESLARLYPDVAPAGVSPIDVFASGLDWPTVHGRGFVLLQKRYAGADDDVWLYRLDRRAATRVLRLTGGVRSSLAGGFVSGNDLIFGAGTDTLVLYRLRNGRLQTLTRFAARPQRSTVSTRAQNGDSVWFVVTLYDTYERGNNPSFLYNGQRLVSLGTYSGLVDMDVHMRTHRIAFLYWEGSERHVVVKELRVK